MRVAPEKPPSYEPTEFLDDASTPLDLSHYPEEQRTAYEAKWRERSARGDSLLYEKRREWEAAGATEGIACRPARDDGVGAAWKDLFASYLDALASGAGDAGMDLRVPEEPAVPFEHLYWPLVRVTEARLRNRLGGSANLLSDRAWRGFRAALVARLSNLSVTVLFHEFDLYRRIRTPRRRPSSSSAPYDDELYRNFVTEIALHGRLGFWSEYPVLPRLVCTVALLWVEYVAEFVGRVSDDLDDIADLVGYSGSRPVERAEVIDAIASTCSDHHNFGRKVLPLTLRGGYRVVYKPRDITIEAAFGRFVEWFNAGADPTILPLRTLRTLNRGHYGWVEFVEYRPCSTVEELRRYVERAGTLVGLVHVLGGVDFHHENLIPSGEQPVLVDLETMLQPASESIDGFSPGLAQRAVEATVLRSGLLPHWTTSPTGDDAHDVSGIGSLQSYAKTIRVQRWHHVNTAAMALELEDVSPRFPSNPAAGSGVTLTISDCIEELTTGFNRAMNSVLKRQAELLDRTGVLAVFKGCTTRFVFRPTASYLEISRRMVQPEALRDGVLCSLETEKLSRSLLHFAVRPRFWSVLAWEKVALQRVDVPLFLLRADGTDLQAVSQISDGVPVLATVVERYSQRSGLDWVFQRIQALDERGIQLQENILRSAIHVYERRELHAAAAHRAGNIVSRGDSADKVLLRAARVIFSQLKAAAVPVSEHAVSWFGPAYVPESKLQQLTPLGFSLYDGAPGISLFFAAFWRMTGDTEARDLAFRALEPLREVLSRKSDRARLLSGSLGVCVGSGSLIYALQTLGRMLGNSEWKDAARTLCREISIESIRRDTAFDVVGGTAGMLHALAAYLERGEREQEQILTTAVECGDHLLRNQRVLGPGAGGWPTLNGDVHTGFSHGGSGIAYALLRLYRLTGYSGYVEAAWRAVESEAAVFDPKSGNWPIVIAGNGRERTVKMLCTWCHGAAGIGLARLGMFSNEQTDARLREIEAAVDCTRRQLETHLDHLCCGNFGRVEFLLSAGRMLRRPEWIEAARCLAVEVAERAAVGNGYGLGWNGRERDVGFFQGLSGIGYELLRLLDPDNIDSVLLFK